MFSKHGCLIRNQTDGKVSPKTGNTKEGKYHFTVDLLFGLFGINSMTTDNLCFYQQNRQFQTSQTGGHQYSDTSPFSIPCLRVLQYIMACLRLIDTSKFRGQLCIKLFFFLFLAAIAGFLYKNCIDLKLCLSHTEIVFLNLH